MDIDYSFLNNVYRLNNVLLKIWIIRMVLPFDNYIWFFSVYE
jgi:hypothetical protein